MPEDNDLARRQMERRFGGSSAESRKRADPAAAPKAKAKAGKKSPVKKPGQKNAESQGAQKALSEPKAPAKKRASKAGKPEAAEKTGAPASPAPQHPAPPAAAASNADELLDSILGEDAGDLGQAGEESSEPPPQEAPKIWETHRLTESQWNKLPESEIPNHENAFRFVKSPGFIRAVEIIREYKMDTPFPYIPSKEEVRKMRETWHKNGAVGKLEFSAKPSAVIYHHNRHIMAKNSESGKVITERRPFLMVSSALDVELPLDQIEIYSFYKIAELTKMLIERLIAQKTNKDVAKQTAYATTNQRFRPLAFHIAEHIELTSSDWYQQRDKKDQQIIDELLSSIGLKK